MRPQELQALYAKHSSHLVGFAKLRLRNREDAEDVVQEVFLRLHEKRIELPGQPRAFLAACVRNAVLDFIRTRKPATSELTDLAEDLFDCQEEDFELRDAVSRSMASLSIEQREVILLHIWQGFRLREIAEATGALADTVASRLRYARSKLRPILRKFASRCRPRVAVQAAATLDTPTGETENES